MKKLKSPWYGVLWIGIWTAALLWFLTSGMFTTRESVGLILVWLVLVGVTLYMLVRHYRFRSSGR
jgi:TRAP-type C4-dicarboxylate transport system permease large subunit